MAPLSGVADTHTHPLSNLGFGHNFVWGDPTEWGNPNTEDLSSLSACDGQTHGGHMRILGTDVFIPVIGPTDFTKRVFLGVDRQGSVQHGTNGLPDFKNWPDFGDGLHNQYHVRFIYRAYKLGNLRLMSALAVNNRLLSQFMANDQDDAKAITDQINAIKVMVTKYPWMEVALTPGDIRRIVGEDRLAVVLGVEVDQLEALCDVNHPSTGAAASWVPWLVEQLYSNGIRQVTPLHFADNSFGGFAVYDDLMNTSDQFATGHFAQVELSADVDFKYSFEQQQFQGGVMPLVVPPPKPGYDRSDPEKGHVNSRGLQPAGEALLNEMMSRGMMIDIDHMSEKTALAAMNVFVGKSYPFMSSHTSIRHLAFRDWEEYGWAPNPCTGGAPIRIGVASERGLSDDIVIQLAKLGGMVSPGTAGGGTAKLKPTPNSFQFPFNQADVPAGSSIAIAVGYLEAVRMLSDAGQAQPRVGLATDFTLTPGCGPRFGPRIGPRPGFAKNQLRQPAGARQLYQNDPGAGGDALPRYSAGGRTYDFNTDGMAHYGLLADYLADLRVIGLSDAQLAPLYASAESYTQMWETCRQIMNINPGDP